MGGYETRETFLKTVQGAARSRGLVGNTDRQTDRENLEMGGRAGKADHLTEK